MEHKDPAEEENDGEKISRRKFRRLVVREDDLHADSAGAWQLNEEQEQEDT
jgi:hypothetical protein